MRTGKILLRAKGLYQFSPIFSEICVYTASSRKNYSKSTRQMLPMEDTTATPSFVTP